MPYNEIAFNFFKKFAELEYLMIEKGIAKIDQNNFLTSADWQKLHAKIKLNNEGSVLVFINKYKSIVTNDHPQQLYFSNNHFEWKLPQANLISEQLFEQKNEKDKFDKITVALRRVRNNLFHGAKIKDPSEWTNERLDQCLPIVTDLKQIVQSSETSHPRVVNNNQD